MKCIILAGGRGTRLVPLTDEMPKPLVKIGDKPVLYHIIERLRMGGLTDFIIAGGYKWKMIEKYVVNNPIDGANIRVIDTGLDTLTGGRLKLLAPESGRVFVTYGDDISDVNAKNVIDFHNDSTKFGITMTGGRSKSNWGHLVVDGDNLLVFKEKPILDDWINIGNFIIDAEICKELKIDETLEDFIKRMIGKCNVNVFKHNGYFYGMNTYADYIFLNELWERSRNWPKIL